MWNMLIQLIHLHHLCHRTDTIIFDRYVIKSLQDQRSGTANRPNRLDHQTLGKARTVAGPPERLPRLAGLHGG